MALTLALGALVGAAVVAGAWLVVVWRTRHPAVSRRVLISLADEDAGLRGLITAQRGAYLILSAGEVVAPGEAPTPIAGDVILERRRILWIQLL
jgi:hypothetical protein